MTATAWYNPATSAFATTDPITQLDNPANANPYAANNIDPTGMFSLNDIGGGLIALGAAVGFALALPVTGPLAVGTIFVAG
jgi:hypothetical protein